MDHRHDIFVSYAHLDDQSFSGTESGWVSELIKGLKIFLNMAFGRAEKYSLWMDHELQGNKQLTPEIIEKLDNASTLVLILSKSYIQSEWCMRELGTFIAKHGSKSSRIFAIIKENIVEKPDALKDLMGYQFWEGDDLTGNYTLGTTAPYQNRDKYFKRLGDIAKQLEQEISSIQNSKTVEIIEENSISTQRQDALETVFLAPVVGSFDEKRSELKRYLEQQNIKVLPKNNEIDISTYEEEMRVDLDQCLNFIQLLDENSDMGIPNVQYKIALENNKPILQWRSNSLKIDAISNDTYRELLEKETVISCNFAEFKQHALNKILPKEKKQTSQLHSAEEFIFINSGPEDRDNVVEISKKLSEKGFLCASPLVPNADTKPSEVRMDLEENLIDCDISLTLYNHSSPVQIRKFLKQAWRISAKREKPLKTALCISSDNETDLNISLPNMHRMCCDGSMCDDCVEKFVVEMIEKIEE